MTDDNPLWGSPLIRAELLRTGLDVTQLKVAKYMNMQKPDLLIILEPENRPQRILHLKIQYIGGIGANMTRGLNETGIMTMPERWAADAVKLERI